MNAAAIAHSPVGVSLDERWYVVGSLKPRNGQSREEFDAELSELCPHVSFDTEKHVVAGRLDDVAVEQRLFRLRIDRQTHVGREDAEAAWQLLANAWTVAKGGEFKDSVSVT